MIRSGTTRRRECLWVDLWEMLCSLPLLPLDGGEEEADPWTPSSQYPQYPLRGSQRASPRSTRILSRTSSHHVQSLNPVPLPASSPSVLRHIPSKRLPGPETRLLFRPTLGWRKDSHTHTPPPCPTYRLARHCGWWCPFFCACASFPAASTGITSCCPKPPVLPNYNNLLRARVPLRCAHVSHLQVWVVLLTLAAHVAPPLPATPLD